jgi:uncharacterized repeat protein (TIGR02543 family)
MAAHAQITTLATLQTAITNTAYGETITITGDITVDELITIPSGKNITLTSDNGIRTLTRGTTGNLITVASGGSLTLENITIDGNNGSYTDGYGSLVYVNGGTLTMNTSAVLQNNNNKEESNGGGVYVYNGTFTMTDGEISGNAAGGSYGSGSGGGVGVGYGTFTMTGGTINNNAAEKYGGGVVVGSGTFTMTGGTINNNTANNGGSGVHVSNGIFTVGGTAEIKENKRNSNDQNVYLINGNYITLSTETPPASGMNIGVYTETASGVIVESSATAADAKYFSADEAGKTVACDGAGLKIVADEDVRTISYNANNGTGTMSSDKVAEGSSYTVKPNTFTRTGYTFTVWNTEPDGNGTDYEEGEEFSNVTADITLYAQWVEVTSSSSSEATPSSSSEEPSSSSEETPSSSSGDNTPIRLPQIANTPISVHATSNAIILQNLPTNAKVEVYNLQGKRVYMGNPENPLIMKIMVQTKGIYIVKVNRISQPLVMLAF